MYATRCLILFIPLLACGCGKESTALLIGNLKAPEAATRIRAARTLPERKADAAQAVPALVEALRDDHTDVRRCAAAGLGLFGAEAKSAVPALQTCLRDREPSVRKTAGVALWQIEPTRFPDPSKPARGK